MNRYNTNTSFIDKLYIMLCLFVLQFIIAFILINPIAKQGIVDPVTKMMIIIKWPELSAADIDVWVKGPDGTTASYVNKDGKYIILERDDLGSSNDYVKINGEITPISRNMETMTINALPKGEYVINLHNYSHSFNDFLGRINEEPEYPIPVTIEVIKINPFKAVFQKTVTLKYREEKTVLSFVITDDEKIDDMRTDVDIPMFYAQNRGGLK